MNEDLDRKYLGWAYRAAFYSPDPRTQNGALLVAHPFQRGGGKMMSGWNHGVHGATFDWNSSEKYELIHHAEESAILWAARDGVPTKDATLYVPWYACLRCARAIIGSGVRRVVGHHELIEWANGKNPSWADDIAEANRLLDDAGVTRDYLDGTFDADWIRHSGTRWSPRDSEEVRP